MVAATTPRFFGHCATRDCANVLPVVIVVIVIILLFFCFLFLFLVGVVAFSPFKEDFVCVCEYNASDKLLMNTQALKTFSTPKKRWIKKITINPKPYTHKCSVSYPISHKKKMKGWDSSSKLSSSSSSSLSLGKKRKFLCRSTH